MYVYFTDGCYKNHVNTSFNMATNHQIMKRALTATTTTVAAITGKASWSCALEKRN
jgi:hypothetical protein